MPKANLPIIPVHSMPALDGLRGIACVMVVIAHLIETARISGFDVAGIGSFGVGLFFCLSGFLMGALYLMIVEFQEKSASRYVISRISRIAPSYLIAITLYITLVLIVPNYGAIDLSQIIRLYLFSGSAAVFWSIPPEVQFYVYFLFFWCALSVLIKRSYTIASVLLMAILVAIALFSIWYRAIWPGILLFSKMHFFMLGLAGAALLCHPGIARIACSALGQATSLVAVIAYYLLVSQSDNFYQDLFFSSLIAWLVTSMSQTTFLNKILTTRFFRFLGAASFSIYLFHGPVIRLTDVVIIPLGLASFATICVVFIFAILLPSLFHLAIEKRLNEATKNFLKKKFDTSIKSMCLFIIKKTA